MEFCFWNLKCQLQPYYLESILLFKYKVGDVALI
jgi:hypothetical protein